MNTFIKLATHTIKQLIFGLGSSRALLLLKQSYVDFRVNSRLGTMPGRVESEMNTEMYMFLLVLMMQSEAENQTYTKMKYQM